MGAHNLQSTATQLYKHLTFVYGTLKTGQPNHHVMRSIGALYVGEAITLDKFPLIVGTKAKLPFLLYHPGHGQRVNGEMYILTDAMLEMLDEFEEHPVIYEREPISVEFVIRNRKLGETRAIVEGQSVYTGSCFNTFNAFGYFFKAFPADQLHRRSLLEEYDAAHYDGYRELEDNFCSSSHVVDHLLCDAC